MKLHTDNLTARDLHEALIDAGLDDVYVEVLEVGSRTRARAFEFRLAADPKAGRRRRRNSGTSGAEHVFAATYDEHGQWMAEIFERDPDAVVGPYHGRDDFIVKTDGNYRSRLTT